jgi:hypothetical protein
MRDVGFLNRTQQTAAFYQLLAMSSWHIGHQTRSLQAAEHLSYSLAATQELQKQIDDPMQCLTNDAVAAVLVFVCSAVSFKDLQEDKHVELTTKNLIHDPKMLNVHMNGLKLMIAHRGGLQILRADPALRLVLFWYIYCPLLKA